MCEGRDGEIVSRIVHAAEAHHPSGGGAVVTAWYEPLIQGWLASVRTLDDVFIRSSYGTSEDAAYQALLAHLEPRCAVRS